MWVYFLVAWIMDFMAMVHSEDYSYFIEMITWTPGVTDPNDAAVDR